MGMLFRAAVGFGLAFYAYDSTAARQWLNEAVVLPIEARCAEGLTLCEGRAAERLGASLNLSLQGETIR